MYKVRTTGLDKSHVRLLFPQQIRQGVCRLFAFCVISHVRTLYAQYKALGHVAPQHNTVDHDKHLAKYNSLLKLFYIVYSNIETANLKTGEVICI